MNSKRLRPLVLCAVLFASIAALAQPTPRWDNNSDAAFVRQILPVLLGRKARGSLEVQLLVDLIEMHGREAVLRMLMEQSEFRDHWTALLTDMLRTRRPEGGGPAQSAACFDAPEPASPGAGSLQGVNAPGEIGRAHV